MKLTLQQCYLTLLVAVSLFGWYQLVSAEKKGPGAVKLCADDFFTLYKQLCLGNFHRFKRSVMDTADVTKDKDFPVLKEKHAKQFLHRIRMPRGVYTDNAREECCVESCTSEEVNEYPCR